MSDGRSSHDCPWEKLRTSLSGTERTGRGRRTPLACSLGQLKGRHTWGPKAPRVILHGPSPQGSLGTHPAPHLTPALGPWGERRRPLLSSLVSPQEGAATTGVTAGPGRALAGQEGDLGGGDGGQGEGSGGVGPQDPVQQLLLLLLELSPQLGLLLQGLAGEKQVLGELPVDADGAARPRGRACRRLHTPTPSSRGLPQMGPACSWAPAPAPCLQEAIDPLPEERGPQGPRLWVQLYPTT